LERVDRDWRLRRFRFDPGIDARFWEVVFYAAYLARYKTSGLEQHPGAGEQLLLVGLPQTRGLATRDPAR